MIGEIFQIGDIFQISKSARKLGYSDARYDVIRCIAGAADIAELDKRTLLWLLEQVNNLNGDKNE
jgi:hypothetical protein